MRPINVLSLFDGMSCGQIALERAGIQVDKYYASEVDKYVIQVTQANFPDTIQLGDVAKVDASTLPEIDLLIGGSPCQGFSFAGKQLNFDDPRSALFFEYVRLLEEVKPTYFLLENVRMKQEYQDVISEALGVKPVRINSALVSAQNRVRDYWTNIPDITLPDDSGVTLKDILQSDVEDKYYLSDKLIAGFNAKHQRYKDAGSKSGFGIKLEPNSLDGKSYCLTARYFKMGVTDPYVYGDKGIRKLTPLECERLQTVPDGYTDHVSNTQRYKMLGNGWTVDVISHIFKGLKANKGK